MIKGNLLNGDFAAFLLLSLWNDNAKNTILHASLDLILVDADREAERSGEFTNAALGDPVLVFRFLRILLLGGFGEFTTGFGTGWNCCIFIFDLWLVNFVFVFAGLSTIGDSARFGCIFNETSWWSSGSVGALSAATDVEGLLVDKFNLNILLLDAREFAVKFINLTGLLDVELRSETLHNIAAAVLRVAVATAAVLVEVVEKTEEGVEGGSLVRDVVSWEERHFACGCLWFENLFESSFDWKS